MKKVLFISLLLLNLVLRGQATASFTASVTIVEPLKVKTLSNLNFSEVRAGTGGVVTLTSDGSREGFGGVEFGEGINTSPASFTISGTPGTMVNLQLPQGEFLLTNGEQTITIKDFTSNWSRINRLKEEQNILKIGASIVVDAEQEPGNYTTIQPLEIIIDYD